MLPRPPCTFERLPLDLIAKTLDPAHASPNCLINYALTNKAFKQALEPELAARRACASFAAQVRALSRIPLAAPHGANAVLDLMDRHAAGLARLETLDLSNLSLSGSTAPLCDRLWRDCPNLRHLSLANNSIEALSQSLRFGRRLQVLNISDNPYFFSGREGHDIRLPESLQGLNLTGVRLPHPGAYSALFLPQLRVLNITDCVMPPAALRFGPSLNTLVCNTQTANLLSRGAFQGTIVEADGRRRGGLSSMLPPAPEEALIRQRTCGLGWSVSSHVMLNFGVPLLGACMGAGAATLSLMPVLGINFISKAKAFWLLAVLMVGPAVAFGKRVVGGSSVLNVRRQRDAGANGDLAQVQRRSVYCEAARLLHMLGIAGVVGFILWYLASAFVSVYILGCVGPFIGAWLGEVGAMSVGCGTTTSAICGVLGVWIGLDLSMKVLQPFSVPIGNAMGGLLRLLLHPLQLLDQQIGSLAPA